jgi:AraC-like DNA-binding protein
MTSGANPLTASATARDFRAFLNAFEPLGYDVNALAAGAGISRAQLDDPDVRVSCSAYEVVVGLAQRTRRTPNLALRLAMHVPVGAFPLLDYLILTCDDIGAGVRQLNRYFRLVGNPIVFDVRDAAEPVRIAMTGGQPFGFEYTAALMLLHFRDETDGRFRAASVHFAHTPDDVAEFERVLGCALEPGARWDGISVSRDAWRLPLRRRDAVLHGVLERQAAAVIDRLPVATSAASAVTDLLDAEVPAGADMRIESVARRLATSPRTLQRRLAAEGLSYQKVLDDWRKTAAERHLTASALSIGEIAYLLGFSEPAPFHRAFKRWYGITPRAFRERQHQGYASASTQ